MSSVWCQVVMPDGLSMGPTVFIKPVPENIAVLCEVVKVKMEITLKYCDAIQLIVFPPGTTDLTNKMKAYKRSCKDFPKVDDEERPLILVAPQKDSGTCVVAFLSSPHLSSPLLSSICV